MRNSRAALLLVTLLTATTFLSAGCDSFLTNEPKSFLTPETAFSSKDGLEGVLVNLNEKLRTEYYQPFLQMILTEYFFTDIAIASGPHWPHDMPRQVTPTGDAEAGTDDYWSHSYEAISDANLLISNVDNVEDWGSEEEMDVMLANGYFHRAYWYYRLVHWFGDVPVYLDAIEEPRLDFNTFSREAVLMKMRDDMEFAVQHLPQSARPGEVNRAAGQYLLTKIYLALQQFQDAVDTASDVIDGGSYALMEERFGQGPYADDDRFNVLWDLHQKENKSSSSNTEAILVGQDEYGVEGNVSGGTRLLYLAAPQWWSNQNVFDPNGFAATTDGPEGNPLSDSLGRGDGDLRTVDHFNYDLWEDGGDDLRHDDVNWFSLDEFYYNNPESEYYGEPFEREYIADTTRSWYPFMYNKLYVPDEIREHRKQGGHSDWYIYRLAGLYLLRAEAHYWLGDMDQAAEDINAVRRRAQATEVEPDEVTIDYIFDERARELWLEEHRTTELTRVAYIMAQLGRDGYSLDDMHQDNWYYDRVMETNVYYREQISYGENPYIMEPYNVYWPIPQDEIDSNVEGKINQTPGYTGWEDNEEPLGYDELNELAQRERGAER